MSSHDLLLSWPFVLLICFRALALDRIFWQEEWPSHCSRLPAAPQHSDCAGRYSGSSDQLRVEGQFPSLTLEQVSDDQPVDQPRISSQGHDGMSMCLGSS